MFKQIINKTIHKVFNVSQNEKAFPIVDENFNDVTFEVNTDKLKQFHHGLKVFSDGKVYALQIDNKPVFFGNIDHQDIVQTINDDMDFYPALIQDHIDSFLYGDNHIPNYMKLIPELLYAVKKNQAEIHEDKVIFSAKEK